MAVLNRNDVIAGYTVQSLIKSNLYTETYRVLDSNSTPFFLKLFILGKIPSKLVNPITGKVKEIEFGKKINHRNIVSQLADGAFDREDGAYQYYITNYFNGQLLSDRIATGGPLPEDEALGIFRKILNGVNYLHKQNPLLCHNDLDVSNIIISDSDKGEPVIIDLGHLWHLSAGTVEFDTTDLNPFFHADETKVNIFDEKGDVFSVSAILYTMLTGIHPWDTTLSDEPTFKARMMELSQFRKGNPLDLDNLQVSSKTKFILERGLKRKSPERFNSIQDIIDILDPSSESPHLESSGQKGFGDGSKHVSDSSGQDDPNQVDFEIKKGGGNGFEDIAGMKDLKELLYRQIIFVLQNKKLAEEYRITTPSGILLYGPPGCGKTYFAEKFAEETGMNFILIKSSDLGSSFVHGTQEKIRKLFKIAEQNAPIVLCFDEFDAFVPDRSSLIQQGQSGEVNEFLSQMNNCAQRGIFIVATSNRPDKIDPAVRRTGRLDKNVYVPLPDKEARREMFSMYLKKRPVCSEIDIDRLAELTEGYIASDIAYIVNDAAMLAAYAREPITEEHLMTSLSNTSPSLKKEVMESYVRIRESMEDSNRKNNIRVVVSGL